MKRFWLGIAVLMVLCGACTTSPTATPSLAPSRNTTLATRTPTSGQTIVPTHTSVPTATAAPTGTPTGTPAPTVTVTATAAPTQRPVATPGASPTMTVLLAETPTPSPTNEGDSPITYEEIRIVGNADFIDQTRLALSLLKTKAPDAYQKVLSYVAIIEQGDRSGMWAAEELPRYEVGDETAFFSVTWYASTIAHDATHSELYHRYLAEHPGESVPGDVWTGIEVERFCNAYQLDVAKRIGGPANEVDYLAGLTGTHCDVDGDGDCDWDDYVLRDW